MKKIYSTILLLIVVFQFLSCNKTKKETFNDKITSKVFIKRAVLTANSEIDDFSFPVDSMLKANILQLEIFHNDEVNPDLVNKTWFGIFKNKDNYTLSETKVAIKRASDPILDINEDEKTGWEVSSSIKDTCVILIEKLPYLENRNIISIKLPESIYPEDNFKFSFNGIDYVLSAIGEKKGSDWIEVSNYKLYLTSKVHGKQVKELLVAEKRFDDQMVKIIFAGDIDGDSKLDLIIDTSNHYNLSRPTIYLSRPAEKGEIIKPMGVFKYVGC